MRIALTRAVSPHIDRCALTHLPREPIDVERAQTQHEAYEDLLRALGCDVQRLPETPELPDSVFVEDAAVVLDELAVVTRPGAASRRPETASVEAALRAYRPLAVIEAPGTLDGGDVLRLGRRLYVGLSGRSNNHAVAQLRRILAPHGYTVHGVDVRGCLHLKSAVTQVSTSTLLVNPDWIDPAVFVDWEIIDIHPEEPFAANALRIGETVVMPEAFARTRARVEARGIDVRPVEVFELARAEGGVTCCSLIVGVVGPHMR